jgi:hypothetical protein
MTVVGNPTPRLAVIAKEFNTADDESWFLRSAQPPWPVLDEAALYGLPGDVVRTLQPHTESDPAALLFQYLIATGNAMGRYSHWSVEADTHYPNEYCVLVGATAKGRKGTSFGQIRKIMLNADPSWTLGHIHSGLSSGEGLIWLVRDEVHVRVLSGSGANKQFVDLTQDPGITDKRALVVETEFAGGVLALLHRDGNILSRVLRDFFDRDQVSTLTRHNPVTATGALVSVIGHATVDELRARVGTIDISNGLINRFCHVCVRRSALLPFGDEVDPAITEELGLRTRRALDFAAAQGRIDLTPAARELWNEIYRAFADPPGLFGAATARDAAHTRRLALIYTLLDERGETDLRHLQAARAAWQYCEDSARYLYGDLLGDHVADAIVLALRQAAPDGLTRTDIIRDVLRSNFSTARLNAALHMLLKYDRARMTKIQRLGPANRLKSGMRPEADNNRRRRAPYELNELTN